FWFYRILIEKHNLEISKPDLFFFTFLIALTVSSIYGVHPLESIIGGSYRHQGVIFFVGLWLIGKTVNLLSIDQKKLLSKIFGAVVLVEVLIVIVQYLTGHLYFGKPLGTMGESNAVFGFLAMGVYFVTENFPKFYLIPLYILVLFSMSRSALLSLVLSSGIFLGKLKSNFRKPMVLLVIILIIIATLYITKGKGNSRLESRPVIWKIAVGEISKKSVLGYGAESGEFIFNKAFLNQDIYLENIIIDRTHNLFLDIAMWSGIVGLIFFVGWMVLSFLGLESVESKFAFFAFLTYSMFQPLSIVHWILLVIIINI
ncbi:MAG TPA: O-antigen ligase family protein, partial [Patescibacteria group bacterium]|nr:O-antigen ligase family protein [Patescibacteria group bacterium]